MANELNYHLYSLQLGRLYYTAYALVSAVSMHHEAYNLHSPTDEYPVANVRPPTSDSDTVDRGKCKQPIGIIRRL